MTAALGRDYPRAADVNLPIRLSELTRTPINWDETKSRTTSSSPANELSCSSARL